MDELRRRGKPWPMPRLTFVAALVLACASSGAAVSATAHSSSGAAKQRKLPPAAQRGLALAQLRCAGCHGVTRNAGSPNPESPPFEAVANQAGLTRATLRAFLRDSHNYPAAMNFTIDRRQVGDLADYMLTLKSRNYRPGI